MKDTTPTGNRRGFLKQTAALTGAVLLSSTSALAAPSTADTLQTAELEIAAELLSEIKNSQKSGLLLVVVEHIGALAASGKTQEVENAVRAVREQVASNAKIERLRRKTRADLSALAREQ